MLHCSIHSVCKCYRCPPLCIFFYRLLVKEGHNSSMDYEEMDEGIFQWFGNSFCRAETQGPALTFLREETYYCRLEEILKEVNVKCVKIDEESRKRNVEISLQVVREVIDMLKNRNPVFKQIYTRTEFVGSYFDGLRVKNATEFDLNIILKLPLNYDKIKVETTNSVAGFVKVNISDAKNHTQYSGECKKVIDKWCDSDGYLLQNKFRVWFEGIFSRLLEGKTLLMVINDKNLQVKLRKSGPAFTLMIYFENEKIDVDLVFTLEFKDIPPPSPIRRLGRRQPWVLVPKEAKCSQYKNLLWRISFPTSEKELLHCLHKLKLTNRLVKALRDAKNLDIPSYFVKTIFLWDAHQCNLMPSKAKFWEKNLGYLFVHAVYQLQWYLKNERLPYYWHKAMNLLKDYDSKHLQNMAGHLRNIIKKIDTYLGKKDFIGLQNYIFSLFNLVILGGVNMDSEVRNDRNYSLDEFMYNVHDRHNRTLDDEIGHWTAEPSPTREVYGQENLMGDKTSEKNQQSCIIQ